MSFVGMVSTNDGIVYFADYKGSINKGDYTHEYNGPRNIKKMFEFDNFVLVTYGNNEINGKGLEEILINLKFINPSFTIDKFCKRFQEEIDEREDINKKFDFIFGYRDETGRYLYKEIEITRKHIRTTLPKECNIIYCMGTTFSNIFNFVIPKINYSLSAEKVAKKLDTIFKSINDICSQMDSYNTVGDKIEIKIFKK